MFKDFGEQSPAHLRIFKASGNKSSEHLWKFEVSGEKRPHTKGVSRSLAKKLSNDLRGFSILVKSINTLYDFQGFW